MCATFDASLGALMATAPKLSIAALRQYIAKGLLGQRELQALCNDPRAGARQAAKRALSARQAQELERQRLSDMLHYEQGLWAQGLVHVAGVDEVGVGPMAGPVVAAAVILPPETSISGINDSKLLKEAERDSLAALICERAIRFAIGRATVEEIGAWNIYRAGLQAMRRALENLGIEVEHVLVDARTIPDIQAPQTPIIKGDTKSQSIAAASILAKVARDREMCELAEHYPGYGFEKHKGYCTPEHMAALERLGPTAVHRRGWGAVAKTLPTATQRKLF